MKPGDTFLVDLGCGEHLHVVLSHPSGEDRSVVVTMISTYDADYKNSTCILRPEDGHPFIKSLSCLAYHLSMLLPEMKLESLAIKRKPAFSNEVLQRILKGADADNSDLPNKFWVILDDQGLIPR